MANFRILSLDGGGSWALIQVKALIDVYGATTTGHQLLNEFDLVAANSGGSIVLGCLIEDFSLAQILKFFNTESQREAVFSPTHSLENKIVRDLLGVGPKYSANDKLPALQHVLVNTGDKPLPDVVQAIQGYSSGAPVHVLIIAFDYDRNRATFFRSAPVNQSHWGNGEVTEISLSEAIHASTNAPVSYFDGPACFPDAPARFWDGAITGCNNPVVAAVTEAIGIGTDPSDIAVLSIGTASVALPWPQPGASPSPFLRQPAQMELTNDLRKLASAILDDPPDIATFLAHVMTGSGRGLGTPAAVSRIVRMNPLVSPVDTGAAWTAPANMTAAQFQYLANLDMDAIEQVQVNAISKYTDLWLQDLALNQPIRMNADTLKSELGYDTYSAAKAAWLAIK